MGIKACRFVGRMGGNILSLQKGKELKEVTVFRAGDGTYWEAAPSRG